MIELSLYTIVCSKTWFHVILDITADEFVFCLYTIEQFDCQSFIHGCLGNKVGLMSSKVRLEPTSTEEIVGHC